MHLNGGQRGNGFLSDVIASALAPSQSVIGAAKLIILGLQTLPLFSLTSSLSLLNLSRSPP